MSSPARSAGVPPRRALAPVDANADVENAGVVPSPKRKAEELGAAEDSSARRASKMRQPRASRGGQALKAVSSNVQE